MDYSTEPFYFIIIITFSMYLVLEFGFLFYNNNIILCLIRRVRYCIRVFITVDIDFVCILALF